MTKMLGQRKPHDLPRALGDVMSDVVSGKEIAEHTEIMQLYTQAIKDYFKTKPNNRKLLKYGKLFGVEDKIRTYMEVL